MRPQNTLDIKHLFWDKIFLLENAVGKIMKQIQCLNSLKIWQMLGFLCYYFIAFSYQSLVKEHANFSTYPTIVINLSPKYYYLWYIFIIQKLLKGKYNTIKILSLKFSYFSKKRNLKPSRNNNNNIKKHVKPSWTNWLR